jgi:hypothetical protein
MAESDILWKASTRATNPLTVNTTGFAAIAEDGEYLTAAISNDSTDSSELDLWGDIELFGASCSAPTSTGGVTYECRVVRTVDGTNYEDSSTDGEPENAFVGTWTVPTSSGTFRKILPQVALPPEDFKIHVLNKTTSTLQATTTNTIKVLFYHNKGTTG